MFLGQFNHTMDKKGRLTIPARFRELVSADGAFIMKGFEKNLMVLPSPAFEAITARLDQLSITDPKNRDLKRLIFSTATQVELDPIGRILIPPFLREIAGLETNVVIIGVSRYFEIWSSSLWTAYHAGLLDSDSNQDRYETIELGLAG